MYVAERGFIHRASAVARNAVFAAAPNRLHRSLPWAPLRKLPGLSF